MVVYKIFIQKKYVMSITQRNNLTRYPASGKIELGKKGKFRRPLRFFSRYGHPPCSEQ